MLSVVAVSVHCFVAVATPNGASRFGKTSGKLILDFFVTLIVVESPGIFFEWLRRTVLIFRRFYLLLHC